MGNCVSSGDREGKQVSDQIDKQLEEDHKKFKRECKILLLGTVVSIVIITLSILTTTTGSGESGKSTIVKQMKIIHQNGFSASELAEYRPVVYKNVLDSAQAIVVYMRKIGIECEEFGNRALAEKVLDYRLDAAPGVSPTNPYSPPMWRR
jgi:guanine nucleotide-binding protein G(i) subunit alpha